MANTFFKISFKFELLEGEKQAVVFLGFWKCMISFFHILLTKKSIQYEYINNMIFEDPCTYVHSQVKSANIV